MRIGIVTPGFSASEVDWCIPVLLNLVRELAFEHDVHVFSLRYPHRTTSYEVFDAKVTPLGGAEVRGYRRLRLLGRATQRVLAEHRRNTFDVLHAYWADEPGFVATMAGRLSRTPVITSVMGGELVAFPQLRYGGQLNRLNRWLTRRAVAGSNLVTAGSQELQRIAASHLDPSRLVTLPLGVDGSMFHPEHPDCEGSVELAGNPALLSVGSLIPIKGHLDLLYAFTDIIARYPAACLHLVGDGPLRTYLERVSGSLGVCDRVVFHGAIDHHLLPDYYRAADLFVLPSRYESQGLAPLEAAACGCPVVGTAVGITPEISEISRTIRPGDSHGLTAAIRTLLGEEEARQRQIELGLDRVNNALNLSRTVERLLGLYRQFLER